jgi:CDP-diacylglycerol---glycerol-3-phosphate 3-phosphatidyltransferase
MAREATEMTHMLARKLEAMVRHYSEVAVRSAFGTLRIKADVFTYINLLLTFGVVWLLVEGRLVGAGLLFLLASSFDIIDGAIARSQGTARRFGAFLDSTIDRYSEMLVFVGLLLYFYYHQPGASPMVYVLIFIASQGSLLTSYVRARAEALQFDGRGGLIERPGRVLLLTFAMISGWLTSCLIVLAILTHISALQRFWLVWKQSKADQLPPQPAQP